MNVQRSPSRAQRNARRAAALFVAACAALSGLAACETEPMRPPGRAQDAGPPRDAFLEREDAARELTCASAGALEIGRCLDRSGAPCGGAEAFEEAVFATLPEETRLDPVIGPQGSTMFALAVRTRGIAPGDPEMVFSALNPQLVLDLESDEGALIASFRARTGFRASAGLEDTYENPQVFFIVDEPRSALSAHTFVVTAVLRDAEGALRCGETRFTTGP